MSATLTPLRRVRLRCLDCAQGQAAVRRCEHADCPLHHLRMGRGSKGTGGVLRPVRAYCLWCCGGSAHEVRECPSTDCPLWPLRRDRAPRRTGPSLAEIDDFHARVNARRAARGSQVLPAGRHPENAPCGPIFARG